MSLLRIDSRAVTSSVNSRVTAPPKVGAKWRTVTRSVVEVDFKNGGVVMPVADRRARAAETLKRLRGRVATRPAQRGIGNPTDLIVEYNQILPSIREAENHQR